MSSFITLSTPRGECCVPIDLTYSKDMEITSACLVYEGREIIGKGCDALALFDLQKQLPAGVKLQCCLACAHGNMCPYSGGIEIYCARDVTITSKDDVCDLFDREAGEIEKRHHAPSDYCEQFSPQREDQYVYNDYWCYTYDPTI